MDALCGKPAARIPFLLLTWGFDYLWKCAGIEPWQLACGSYQTWLEAYVATYERHTPDVVILDSFGTSDADPVLLDETSRSWIVRDGGGDLKPRFNIAPGQDILAVVRRENTNRLSRFRWGLIPPWADDPAIGNRLINARAETVAQKPSFRF